MKIKSIRKLKFPYATESRGTSIAFATNLRMRRSPKPSLNSVKPILLFLTQTPDDEPIVYMDPHTGTWIGEVFPDNTPVIVAMEWDGRSIWVTQSVNGPSVIKKISPQTGMVRATYTAPWADEPEHFGKALGWDSNTNFMYSSAGYYHQGGTKVQLLNDTAGVVSSFYPPSGILVDSLAIAKSKDLRAILIGDNKTGKLHALRYDAPQYEFLGSADLPGSGYYRAESMAYDEVKNELYIASESDQIIYVVRVTI